MTEVNTGVVEPVAPTVEAQPVSESSTSVSDDGAKVDRKVYEKVREDMLKYKDEKKAKDAELAEIKARLAAVEAAKVSDDDGTVSTEDVRTKANVEVLMLVNTDPFVKENLALITEKMSDDNLTAKEAVKAIKAEFFDRMQKEVSQTEPEVPPKQVTPKGTSTTNVIKEALEGRLENADPRQLEAYKATLARLG